MYIFKVHGKEYKVRFTYRTICRGDVLDRFTAAMQVEDMGVKEMLNHIVTVTAETLLAGLQKFHSNEFGYDTDEQKQKLIDDIFDLFDDYEDESTEDHPQSAATLFTDLKDELEKNGFLSAMSQVAEDVEQTIETAETVKKEMETEPARTKLIDMPPTESKS